MPAIIEPHDEFMGAVQQVCGWLVTESSSELTAADYSLLVGDGLH